MRWEIPPILKSLLFLLLLTGVAHADDAAMHTTTHTDDNGVDVICTNDQTAELTVTLNATTTGLRSSAPLPYTFVLGPRQTVRALRFEKIPGQAWNFRWSEAYDWGTTQAHNDANYVYTLPFDSGQAYRVSQGFNGHIDHSGDFQYAVDFAMPVGTRLRAARGGVVVATDDRFTEGGPDPSLKGRNNKVMIKHSDGTYGEYNHLSPHRVLVGVGQHVRAGQIIGYSGNTGFTTGPHLHFVVYKAIDGHHRQSYPMRFRVAGSPEPVFPVEQTSYRAP